MAEADSQTRKVLLGVVLVSLVGYLSYEYAYRPRAEEVAGMEQRLETLRLQNETARQLVASHGREGVEQQLAGYRRQLQRVESLIPSSEELPDLLDAISAEAQRTGLELTLIQPVGATQEEFYTRRTYDIAVLGPYHQIGEFLARVGSLPRIVTPINLNMTVQEEKTRGGGPRLLARFAIETYVLSAESPMDATDAE